MQMKDDIWTHGRFSGASVFLWIPIAVLSMLTLIPFLGEQVSNFSFAAVLFLLGFQVAEMRNTTAINNLWSLVSSYNRTLYSDPNHENSSYVQSKEPFMKFVQALLCSHGVPAKDAGSITRLGGQMTKEDRLSVNRSRARPLILAEVNAIDPRSDVLPNQEWTPLHYTELAALDAKIDGEFISDNPSSLWNLRKKQLGEGSEEWCSYVQGRFSVGNHGITLSPRRTQLLFYRGFDLLYSVEIPKSMRNRSILAHWGSRMQAIVRNRGRLWSVWLASMMRGRRFCLTIYAGLWVWAGAGLYGAYRFADLALQGQLSLNRGLSISSLVFSLLLMVALYKLVTCNFLLGPPPPGDPYEKFLNRQRRPLTNR